LARTSSAPSHYVQVWFDNTRADVNRVILSGFMQTFVGLRLTPGSSVFAPRHK
jgi:hypothetical protein